MEEDKKGAAAQGAGAGQEGGGNSAAETKTDNKPGKGDKPATESVQLKAAKKIAAGIFSANKELKEVFVASDGTPFYNEGDAKNHAKSLKNKTVTAVKKSEV